MQRPMTLLAFLTLAACGNAGTSGSTGPTGLPGPAGSVGPAGPSGSDGAMGMTGPAVVISERAKAGLDTSPVPISLTGLTSAQVEQLGLGSYLVNSVSGCADCHNQNGAMTKFLAGGSAFPLDGAGHVVYARNLTPDAQTGLKLTEAEFIDTMRTGKDHTNAGEGLPVMPWPAFRWMSTADLKAIYAYLKAIPAVSNAVTADNKGPFAGAPVAFPTMYNEGDVSRPLPAEADQTGAAIPDPSYVRRGLAIQPLMQPASFGMMTAEEQAAFGRGSYLVNSGAACNDCHTNADRDYTPGATFLKINTAQYLAGGRVFAVPPPLNTLTKQTRSMSANLSGVVNGFIGGTDFPTFLAIVQTGTHADDSPAFPLAFPMPWSHYRGMTLEDLSSIFTYLKHIPGPTGVNDKMTQDPAVYCAMDADCNTAGGETCATASHECIGKTCAGDKDCGACQTCTALKCAAPAAGAACLTAGI